MHRTRAVSWTLLRHGLLNNTADYWLHSLRCSLMSLFPQGASQRNLNTRLSLPWRRKALATAVILLKNYRPVSNLPFLSKLFEKIVQNQLQHHITSNDAMPKFQSAYRQFHSTETALIKIFNDLLLAADQGIVSVKMTSAFDTVDHALLLIRLQRSFGVEGGCLALFTSYLSGRSYCVVINGVASYVRHPRVRSYRFLGPLLFILYRSGFGRHSTT